MEAAQLLVEVDEAGGDARQVAVAAERHLRHVDRLAQRVGEADEAALELAILPELEQLRLGALDLAGGGDVEVVRVGVVDHVLPHPDQLAAQEQVVDGAAVIGGADHRHDAGREFGEIRGAAQVAEILVALEESLEGDGVGGLPALDQAGGGVEDPAMDGIEEMLGAEELGDALQRAVADQQRAQKRLLGLLVAGRLAEPEPLFAAVEFDRGEF